MAEATRIDQVQLTITTDQANFLASVLSMHDHEHADAIIRALAKVGCDDQTYIRLGTMYDKGIEYVSIPIRMMRAA